MKRHTDLLASSIMNDRGYTLIELLITIAILGILAGVAITSYVGVTKKAARTEAYSTLESLRLLQEQFYAENGAYVVNASYMATPATADGGIEDLLPGFRPGGCTACASPFGLNYTYTIEQNQALPGGVIPVPYDGTKVAQTPCFIGVATGVLGTRVCPIAAECDVFAIDCNNNRNF